MQRPRWRLAALAAALRLGAARRLGAPPRPRLAAAGGAPPPVAAEEAIPNVVFLTGPWDPLNVVQRSAEVLPKGAEFRFYNYSQMDQSVLEISPLLEREGVYNVSDAFQSLRPRSFRTDLWRYMVLWQSGGIYLDAKIALTAPVSTWVDQQRDSLAVCWDRKQRAEMYWTAMLAARRGSPTLLAIIRQIVSNVQARYYGPPRGVDHADLYITGPGMLTEVLRRETPRGLRSSCRLHVSQMWKVNIPESKVRETTGRKRVIAEVDEDVHRAMRSCDNCDSYGSLFQRHQVYCSERGPRCQFSVTPLPPAERYASLVVS